MTFINCRCGAKKCKGDICASCGAGMPRNTLKIRKQQPIAVTTYHKNHSVMMVPSTTARALVRF